MLAGCRTQRPGFRSRHGPLRAPAGRRRKRSKAPPRHIYLYCNRPKVGKPWTNAEAQRACSAGASAGMCEIHAQEHSGRSVLAARVLRYTPTRCRAASSTQSSSLALCCSHGRVFSIPHFILLRGLSSPAAPSRSSRPCGTAVSSRQIGVSAAGVEGVVADAVRILGRSLG